MSRRRNLALGAAAVACAVVAFPLAATGSSSGPRKDPKPTWTPGTLAYPPPPENPQLATIHKLEARSLSAAARGKVTPTADRTRLTAVKASEARCRSAWITIGVRNASAKAAYSDLTADAGPLKVSRPVFSTYVPASYEARVQVKVAVPDAVAPGEQRLRLSVGRERLTVPVTVAAPGPGLDNLACGRRATASSQDASGRYPAASVTDGDTNGETFGVGNGWNDATAYKWPDTLDVELGKARRIGRVVLHTLGSNRYAVGKYGLRDWDVQVRANGSWTTVARTRGNASVRVEQSFAPVTGDAVRIVCLGSNDNRFSRVIELEAFAPKS
ncbi:discoidin domain-containing protein [Spirillospora sp. CA-294931]|uniref:discoidin domain-containing protein n=1 Tax=Spirillospora sp. CA-294931 TaxID=3240042 RepID=UPI003D8ABA60